MVIFVHRKRVFTIAAAFLIIALVVPPTLVVLAVNNTIYNIIIPGTRPSQGSPTGIQITITNQERQTYNTVIIVAALIEVIFIALFVVTIYYGINHTHPEH